MIHAASSALTSLAGAPAHTNRKRTTTLLALGAAALSLWGTSAQALGLNLVQNSSFEDNGGAGQFQGTDFFIFTPVGGVPATSVSGWTVTGLGAGIASIRDNKNLTQWPALASVPLPPTTSGAFYFQADGDTIGHFNASISQIITTLIQGNTYQLSFDWAAAPFFPNTLITSGWDITFGKDNDTVRAAAGPNAFSGWTTYTKIFTATSPSQTLRFLSSGTPAGQPPFSLLDNVQLREISPVPGPLGVLGAATAFGYSRRIRRRIRRG